VEEHNVVIRRQSNINLNKWEATRGANRLNAIIKAVRALPPVGTREAARLRLSLKLDTYDQYELHTAKHTEKTHYEAY
jgi:recombinational DNA repair protein RecR